MIDIVCILLPLWEVIGRLIFYINGQHCDELIDADKANGYCSSYQQWRLVSIILSSHYHAFKRGLNKKFEHPDFETYTITLNSLIAKSQSRYMNKLKSTATPMRKMIATMQEVGTIKKIGILSLLSLTGSAYVILLRYSRVISNLKYISTTVLALQELIKMTLVISVLLYNCASVKELLLLLRRDVINNKTVTLKMAAPSLLYAIQNNLSLVALEHINVPTHQILYQLKIPFTALLCVVWLKTILSWQQWIAVLMIFAGTGAIEHQTGHDRIANSASKKIEKNEENYLIGTFAIVLASLCSAVAGVYLEKLLKCEDTSIWIKNVQMYVWSIPITLLSVAFQDLSHVSQKGFFFDYNLVVWIIVFVSSVGGILISLVLLYTDNVTKSFSASTSILLSTIASYLLFDYHIGAYFVGGMTLVCCAIFVYAIPFSNLRFPSRVSVDKV